MTFSISKPLAFADRSSYPQGYVPRVRTIAFAGRFRSTAGSQIDTRETWDIQAEPPHRSVFLGSNTPPSCSKIAILFDFPGHLLFK